MRLNGCLTILPVSILAALAVHLEAYSEDCDVEMRVRRYTVYDAYVGEELRMNCTVVLCNHSSPTVSWFKHGETDVPVNVSSSSHIKTEWKKLDNSQGMLLLIFKKIFTSHLGQYLCWNVGSMSHNMISVSGEDCEVKIRVRRYIVYNASVGEELRINCTVVLCNDSPPTVSWFKLGKTDVPVNVSRSSHIKTEWKKIDDSQGISFLIFKKILMSDSGQYQCRAGGSMGHNINVSVAGLDFLHYVFRIVAIVVFVIVVMIIYVALRSGCKVKGVRGARRPRETPDLSPHHIYENDPTTP